MQKALNGCQNHNENNHTGVMQLYEAFAAD
jgi:hypothetical protein